MGEPLTRIEADDDGALANASLRLEQALAKLEANLGRVRPAASPDLAADALNAELSDTRRREQALQAAASDASVALGRAMSQVRQALQRDGEIGEQAQGVLDLELESRPLLPDDETEDLDADEPPSEQEPTA